MAREIESALSAAKRGAKALGKGIGELQLSYRAGVIQGRLEAARAKSAPIVREPLSPADRAILESMLREDPSR